jgi:hypothetical protein
LRGDDDILSLRN